MKFLGSLLFYVSIIFFPQLTFLNDVCLQVLLGIVLVYIHSLIAFMFFRNDFDVSKGLYCDSVLQCFVTILSHG